MLALLPSNLRAIYANASINAGLPRDGRQPTSERHDLSNFIMNWAVSRCDKACIPTHGDFSGCSEEQSEGE